MEPQFPVEMNHRKAEGVIRITWSDGHVGDYAQQYLRGYCPCALCQGHGAEIKFIDVPDAVLEGIRPVGNYAIDLQWRDGHSTGIYTYEYLRALCPCPACRGADSDCA